LNFTERHIERLESENSQLHEKMALLKVGVKRLKEQSMEKDQKAETQSIG
jgi:predicted nuclease with TOPRIM domain